MKMKTAIFLDIENKNWVQIWKPNQFFMVGPTKNWKLILITPLFSSSQIPFSNSYFYQCHVLIFFEKEISTIHWTFHLNKGFNELIHLKLYLCKSLNEVFIFFRLKYKTDPLNFSIIHFVPLTLLSFISVF